MDPTEIDPFSDEVLANPYPFYEAVREACPAYEAYGPDTFLLTRYDDVLETAKRPDVFSNERPLIGAHDPDLALDPRLVEIAAEGYPEVPTLSDTDPPEHTRYRQLVNRSFSPRAVARIEPSIREIVNAVIDDFIEDGQVEFVSQFADLVPGYVIADALGVPRKDLLTFKSWSDDILDLYFSPLSADRKLQCLQSFVELQRYLAELIERRRTSPQTDLASQLLTSRIAGERALTVPEIIDMARQFLVAGNETTASLIESAMLLLLDHPDVFKQLYEDRSLISPMIEEAVRLVSPAQWLPRVVKHPTTVGGVSIPAGANVRLAWAAANRDPKYFPDPDRFDINRDHSTHLAFGHGIHFCLGAALARTEARISFEAILDRITDIRLAIPRIQVKFRPHIVVRRLGHLPLQFLAA